MMTEKTIDIVKEIREINNNLHKMLENEEKIIKLAEILKYILNGSMTTEEKSVRIKVLESIIQRTFSL